MIINLAKIDFAGGSGSGGGGLTSEQEFVISQALNNLNARVGSSNNNTENTEE